MAISLKFSKSDNEVPWGFRLVGGQDFEQPIVVVKVNPDSLAESAGLEVGDIIVRINDTSTAGLTHTEVHDLLLSAGLEFELGVRKEAIMPKIINEDDFDIKESNALKKAIEEEVLNEAITVINNMKNSGDTSKEQVSKSMNGNLSGQEEIINTVTLQTATDVKKGKKWSTFLIKPDTPIPEKKKPVEVKPQQEPYKVVIQKQPRRPFNQKKVQFDQKVTEVEVDFETEETVDINEKQLESVEVEVKITENEEICIEEMEASANYDFETKEEESEEEEEAYMRRDSLEIECERRESLQSEEKSEITPSLEEQLLAVQRQLKALSQLPSAIQITLDAVSKQLASIVKVRDSAERNGDQASNSKEELEEPQTEEEFLEDTSASEKAEAEVSREDSEANSSILGDMEEEVEKEEELEEDYEENGENREKEEAGPYAGLTEEEKEELIKKEELEAKKKKKMEERTPRPVQRPIILPGGRKWSMPEDAIPSFKKPKMSDEKIIETIESNLEVIIGKRKGESNCWKVPSRAVATKSINFLKYQPPPKNLDYLQRSEVYRLVHDMEPPVKGIVSRAEKIPAVQDYYEATKGAP